MLINGAELWKEYELIDTGNFRKLERFGSAIVSRPEPQAWWNTALPEKEWDKLSHAVFTRAISNDDLGQGEKGNWKLMKTMPADWKVCFTLNNKKLSFQLGMSAFKHVGLFPEQAANWTYIYNSVSAIPKPCRVLNLFAYTGGASLVARAAGAEVYHVDSVKQVVTWANQNMLASGLTDIHWVVEDATKFVKREATRGSRYQGIILDPPVYGRGPAGEKWTLAQHLNPLLELCRKLLDSNNSFILLNTYSLGISPLITDNLIRYHFPAANPESGEIYIADAAGRKLPLGAVTRFRI
ncbi:MAG TPA: class I SAM-dependent methyltransferase [Bacteroidales bacterium]|nr:class I SAM-dependent methyltransferase [Bacteroidales bacterium]HQL69865.1 class I SAM-dependent methyltransferase [Bacteroidales bacterium]